MSKRASVFIAFGILLAASACTVVADGPAAPAECGGADLTSDGANCGVCGRSCGGGTCTEGVCQEAVIASGQAKPTGVTVTDDAIYWTNEGAKLKDGSSDGQIVSCPILGCDESGPKTLRSGLGKPFNPIVAGDSIYFIHGAYVLGNGGSEGFVPVKLGIDGTGTPLPLIYPGAFPAYQNMVGLAVDGSRMYFARRETSSGKGDAFVADCPTSGCPNNGLDAYSIAMNLKGTSAVIVDAKFVYYTEVGSGTIARAPRSTRATTELYTAEIAVPALAQDDEFLYWGTALPASSSPNVKVQNYLARGPKAGGTREKLAPISELAAIAVAGDFVYFAETTGRIGRVAKTGGKTETLATAQLEPRSLTVHGDFVYWVTYADGGVHRVAK